jgi:hypothetical protein
MIKIVLLSLSLLASTCAHGSPITPDPSPSTVVPFPPDPAGAAGASGCAAACAKLAQLGCPESKPTPRGASCVEVCSNMSDDASPVSAQTDCVVRAGSCDDAKACQAIP